MRHNAEVHGSGLQFCTGILITKKFYVSDEEGSKRLNMLFYAKVSWKVTLTTYILLFDKS